METAHVSASTTGRPPRDSQRWDAGTVSSPGSNSGSGTRPAPTGGPETARDAPHRPRKSPPQQAKHPTTPSPRGVPAGGGRIEPQSFLFHHGTAVTAGSGPQTERKAASRRVLSQTNRRPARGPRKSGAFVGRGRMNEVERMSPAGGRSGMEFILTRSEGPFLFPQKKKRSLPPSGRPPGF